MSQRLFQEPQCVGEREREAAGRVNTMAAAFCVDFGCNSPDGTAGRAADGIYNRSL
jgi:hypothetical protein